MKPEDRRILLDVAECRRLAELALDQGDIDAFVDFLVKAEAELFCLIWRQELTGPLSPTEELTELQAFQADAQSSSPALGRSSPVRMSPSSISLVSWSRSR